MTIGLIRWLRSLAPEQTIPHRRPLADLHMLRLSARDLADLNLPDHVAAGLRAREEADEVRRRLRW